MTKPSDHRLSGDCSAAPACLNKRKQQMKTMNKLMICMCIACALAPITALLTGCAQKNSFAQAGASGEMTSPPAVSQAGNTAAVPKTEPVYK